MALWGRKSPGKPEQGNGLPAEPQGHEDAMPHPADPGPAAGEPGIAPAHAGEHAAPQQSAVDPGQAAGEATAEAALSQEEMERRAVASKRLLMSFGEIVSVMMRSPQFKAATLSDLEHLVVPAVSSGQFLVAEAQSKQNGFITPVSVALWASVSDEVDQRLSSNPDEPIKLAPDEWRSGDNPWLIALAGDRRPMNSLLKRLHETTFKEKPLKVRTRGEDGAFHVKSFTPAAEA